MKKASTVLATKSLPEDHAMTCEWASWHACMHNSSSEIVHTYLPTYPAGGCSSSLRGRMCGHMERQANGLANAGLQYSESWVAVG